MIGFDMIEEEKLFSFSKFLWLSPTSKVHICTIMMLSSWLIYLGWKFLCQYNCQAKMFGLQLQFRLTSLLIDSNYL